MANITGHHNKKYFSEEDKRLNMVYKNMKKRCYNKNNPHYKYYGAKGIKICDEWLSDCLVFIKWAKENGYKDGTHLHRKNKKKDYCPKNCVWLEVDKHNKLHLNEKKRYLKINDTGIRRKYTRVKREYNITSWRNPMKKLFILFKYIYSKIKKYIIDIIRPPKKQKYFRRHPKRTGLEFLKELNIQEYKGLLKRLKNDNIQIIDNKIVFNSRAELSDYTGIPKSTIIYLLREKDGYTSDGLFRILKEEN